MEKSDTGSVPIQDLLWLQTNGPLADRAGAANASADVPSPPHPWLQTNGPLADRVGAANASADVPSPPHPWLQTNGPLADRVGAANASADVPQYASPHPSLTRSTVNTSNAVSDAVTDVSPDFWSVLENFVDYSTFPLVTPPPPFGAELIPQTGTLSGANEEWDLADGVTNVYGPLYTQFFG